MSFVINNARVIPTRPWTTICRHGMTVWHIARRHANIVKAVKNHYKLKSCFRASTPCFFRHTAAIHAVFSHTTSQPSPF